MQKERIDSIIDESYGIRALPKPIFTMKDQVAFLTNKVVRWMIKVPQRVAGWPRKIKRRLKL